MSTVEKITRTINDPAASDLLRFICAKSLARDPVDAVKASAENRLDTISVRR